MIPQSVPPASPLRSDTQFSDAVPGALKGLVDRFGTTLLGDAQRLRGLLADEMPHAKKEISVLLLALEERVPQDLMRVHSGEPISSLSPRLARRLTDDKALSADAARWAVHAWAQGLGVQSVLTSQPVLSEPGPTRQDGELVTGFAAAHSAANQHFGTPPAPAPSPWGDKRVRIGAGALATLLLGVVLWWFSVPRLDITRVETQGLFIGNGKPVPVFIDFEARNTHVRSAEVRLVRGDGDWGQTSWRVDLAPEGSQNNRVAAGTLQITTARPVSATFEYVLISADGKRSTPFERTFDVVPPLVITKVNVPRPTLVGKEFALDFAFQKSTAEIVRVERKVVDSSQPWAQNEHAVQLKLGADATAFQYKFDPFPKTTRATLEFTLVDAAGVRSDPVRVALNVTTPGASAPGTGPGEVVAVRQVGSASANDWTTAATTAAGAVLGFITGRQIGKGGVRTGATVIGTVGGGWAGYEVGKRLSNSDPNAVYETTVRLDDSPTRVISTRGAPPWSVGSRVVWDGKTLSPGTPR